MKTSRIIIAIVVLALMASQFIFASDQEFDIGDGRRLVLHDDGTYEVVHAQVDTSLVVGSQYVIDMDSTMELALEYAILEDPSVALLGKDLLLSMMQETGLVELIEEQIPDFSMIFLDMERVLFTMEGEDPVEYPYRIASVMGLSENLSCAQYHRVCRYQYFPRLQISCESVRFFVRNIFRNAFKRHSRIIRFVALSA